MNMQSQVKESLCEDIEHIPVCSDLRNPLESGLQGREEAMASEGIFSRKIRQGREATLDQAQTEVPREQNGCRSLRGGRARGGHESAGDLVGVDHLGAEF